VRDLVHRMILVRKGAVKLQGPQPLELDGFWEGTVLDVIPVLKDGKTVDHTLCVQLACGTARADRIIELAASSKYWRLRFPKKT
jgi:hypothetical protein